MLRNFMSSIMRCRSGVICLVMGILLSAGLHERAILTGTAFPHSGVNAVSSITAALERNVPNLPFGI